MKIINSKIRLFALSFIIIFCYLSIVHSQSSVISLKVKKDKPLKYETNSIYLPSKVHYFDQQTTIYTPRGTAVTAYIFENFVIDYTPNSDWMQYNYTYSNFSQFWNKASNVTLDSADRRYNCHGYAWHMYPNNIGEPVFIGTYEARKYGDPPVGDGSYSRVELFSDCERIVFTDYDHSAVNATGDINRLYSKWYLSRLMEHPENDNPFTGGFTTYYARAHDVPYEHNTISDAINNAKSSQVVKLWTNYTLPTSIDFRNQNMKKLEIRPGVTLNLGSNYVQGKIYLNGSVSPDIQIISSSSEIIGLYSSIEQALQFVNSGEIISVHGNNAISNSISIPYGITLQISSGSNITSNGSIYVNGSFIASGTIFNFSGGGISVTNPGSIDLSNCTVNGASTGVYLSNAAPNISGCKFTNCGYGVHSSNYSNPYIRPGLFQNNDFGVYSDMYSSPICGGSVSYKNNDWDIFSTGVGSIYAQGNYWGVCTDPPTDPNVTANVDFSARSCVDFYPKLDVNGLPSVIDDISLSLKSFSGKIRTIETDLEKFKYAQLLFINKKYEESLIESESIVKTFPNSNTATMAVVLIERCLEKMNRDKEVEIKLDELSRNNKGNKISGFTDYRKACLYVNNGSFSDAINLFKTILHTTSDSIIVKNSIYQIGNLSYSYNNDKIMGNEYFNQLIINFPDDPLTKIAEFKLGSAGTKNFKKLTFSKIDLSSISMQNYPNPFNPSTTIEYQLSSPGKVCIKIFDILGMEVKTLINENRVSGIYKIIFNGSNISSGNYIYRMEFISNEGKKEVLQKTMQLVK